MQYAAAWLIGLGHCLLASAAAAEVAVTGLRVDGRLVEVRAAVPGQTNRPGILRLGPRPREVEFTADARQPEARQPYRLRYKLEGADTEWRDLVATMRIVIRFLDAEDLIIGAAQLAVRGDSLGWRGSIEKSEFTPFRLEGMAPERAAKVQVWIVSGGSEHALGYLAVRNVRLQVGPPDGPPTRRVSFSTETGQDLDHPLGSLEDWRRDGSRPEMAHVLRLARPQPHHVLALVDSDWQRFAAWLNPPHKCVPVQPGKRVVVEWEGCYSVGHPGPGVLTYQRLPAGNYWLRVAAVGMDGAPIGAEVSLPFVVLAPVWQRPWFWLMVGSSSLAGGVWGARHITRRRFQRRLELVERQHMLERERTRIARDIHDDLGTRLTQISMLSASARSNPNNPPETAAELDRICAAARAAVQAMDEIVWALNPENDSLDEFATYLSGFAQELLGPVGVRCRLNMPMQVPVVLLSAELRHDLFLAFKEALNNAIRHGHARTVEISMDWAADRLVLTVADDGSGFILGEQEGNGLANMRKRIQKAGGTVRLESAPGQGTRVQFVVPLPAQPGPG